MVDAGDLATWASAVVAIIAAGIAWRQTREARKSRVAAETQAVEAEKSRKAAETQAIEAEKSRKVAEVQARAAEEQVALMRAERDDRDAPEFSVSAIDSFAEGTNYVAFAAKVELRMDRGRALRSVTVTASGDYVVQSGLRRFGGLSGEDAAGIELTFDDIRPGSVLVFYASTEDGYVGSAIALDLTCRERDGEDRTWHRHYATTIAQRPQPPRSYSRFTAG